MAVVYNPSNQDKDKDQQQNQEQQGASQPATMNAGNSAPITASSNNTTPSNTGTSSGRFTNITNYLNANKNFNAQGGGLGGKIVNNVQQQNQNLNTNVQNASQTFNQQAEQNRKQFDQTFVNNAVSNPTAVANNEQDLNKFSQMRDASYQGPTNLQEAPKLQVQAQNIQDQTAQLGTEQGRFNSLRQMFNRPTYSSGQQKLDNLLVQNDPNQVKQLNNSRVLGNQAQNTVARANTAAQAQGQLYTQEAANTKQATADALNQGFTAQQAALQAKVDAGKALNQRLVDEVKNKKMTAADAKLLGITGGELYNLDPSQYMRNIDPTLQNVANSDDYAKYTALSKLADKDPTLLDQSQVGKFDTESHFDKDSFNNALAQQKAAYESEYNPALSRLNRDKLYWYEGLQKDINDAYNIAKNGGMVTTHTQDGDSSTYSPADAAKAAALAKYVYNLGDTQGNQGWTAHDNWLWANANNMVPQMQFMDRDTANSLLGANNRFNNDYFWNNRARTGDFDVNSSEAKLAAIQKLYNIGNKFNIEE